MKQKSIYWFTNLTTDFNSISISFGMEYDYSLKIKSYGTECKERQKVRKRTFSDGGKN